MLFRNESFWFAVYVKCGSELAIASVLKSKGYEEFVPTYRSNAGRRGVLEKPLFAGYVFCRFDPSVRAPIVTTPGVIRVVGYGKTPACLSDSEMQSVRAVAESKVPAKPHPYLVPGQRVRMQAGPLRGVEGEISEAGNRRCLIVSLSLLQRSIAVEVEHEWLEIAQSGVVSAAALTSGHHAVCAGAQ